MRTLVLVLLCVFSVSASNIAHINQLNRYLRLNVNVVSCFYSVFLFTKSKNTIDCFYLFDLYAGKMNTTLICGFLHLFKILYGE